MADEFVKWLKENAPDVLPNSETGFWMFKAYQAGWEAHEEMVLALGKAKRLVTRPVTR